MFTGLEKFFRLSFRLAVIDFKLRNEGSYLGILWYLLNPILLFLILLFIFFDRVGGSIESYPAYLIIGIITFNFFRSATHESTRTILDAGLIKSLNIPRESLVLASVLKNFFSHVFETLVFFIILYFLGVPFYGIALYIIIAVFLFAFIYGTSLALSALTVYMTDLSDIWQFFTTLLLFSTPIFYAIEGQTRLFMANLLNPLYYFITAARESIIYASVPEPWIILGVAGYPLVAVLAGTLIFNRLKKKFPEMI